jgi:hypothetical protein
MLRGRARFLDPPRRAMMGPRRFAIRAARMPQDAPHDPAEKTYRSLNAELIVKTLSRLRDRIEERFPNRGLCAVAAELLTVARADTEKTRSLLRPYLWVRLAVVVFIAAGVAAQVAIFRLVGLRLGADSDTLDVFQGIEAALNTLILMGAGVFFVTTLEERIKRRRSLSDLHELRSIAHVIDMHQLTKDPASIVGDGAPTKSSPEREMSPFELSRYLDYCAEMLSLTGKLAALYAQNTRDSVVIQAVNEIEDLTTSLSGKIWQKLVVLQSETTGAAPRVAPAKTEAVAG